MKNHKLGLRQAEIVVLYEAMPLISGLDRWSDPSRSLWLQRYTTSARRIFRYQREADNDRFGG